MFKLKKILSMLLALVMLFSFNIITTASSPQNLTGNEWVGYTLGKDYYFDETGDIVYTYERQGSIPIQQNGAEKGNISTDNLSFTIKYAYNSTKKVLKFSVNVDSGNLVFKPDLSLSLGLQKANNKNGAYTSATSSINCGKMSYLKDYTITCPTATKHYKFILTFTSNDPNTTVLKPVYTDYTCRNRTGKVWEFYKKDPHSGVTISEPPTNWAVSQGQRVPGLNKIYEKNYNAKYGTNIVVGESVKIDVHHVRPLKYGGTNNMSNLIHIPTSFHSKITGWFNGY